jgi:hypothetical protein
MFRRIRFVLLTGLMILSGWMLPSGVRAASSDTIKLYVAPVVSYGITITSVNASGYDFGTVSIGGVTHSTAAIVVKNTGNVTARWQMRVTNSTDWSAALNPGNNQFALLGVFTSTASASAVNPSEFTDGQDEILNEYQNATGTTNAGKYNAGVDMDTVMPQGQSDNWRNLWLKLKMPTSSSVATQQEMHLYITAGQ